MKFREFLKKEQSLVDEYLKAQHGYELLWFGPPLIAGPSVSPIKRHIRMGFSLHSHPSVVVDKEALPFEENSIDCVVLSHVLELEKNPQPFLKEIVRVLRQDGKLLILGFNPWNLWTLCFNLIRFQGLYLPGRLLKELYSGEKMKSPVFRGAQQVSRWLRAESFELEKRSNFLGKGYVLLFRKKTVRLKPLVTKDLLTPVFESGLLDPKPRPCPHEQWKEKEDSL